MCQAVLQDMGQEPYADHLIQSSRHLQERNCPRYADEETEAQTSEGTFPESHDPSGAVLECDSKSVWLLLCHHARARRVLHRVSPLRFPKLQTLGFNKENEPFVVEVFKLGVSKVPRGG